MSTATATAEPREAVAEAAADLAGPMPRARHQSQSD